MPHLNELADAFSADPVVILAVSQESPLDIIEFLDKKAMNAWVASDPDGSAARAMGVAGLPSTYLIDPAGEIVWQGKPWELEAERIAAELPE